MPESPDPRRLAERRSLCLAASGCPAATGVGRVALQKGRCTMRVVLSVVAVLALASTAPGEQRYEVWEDGGWIWGRDTQISEE